MLAAFPKMQTRRPRRFRLNARSPLAADLVLAALGQFPGTLLCRDTSLRHNDGTLVNMDPASDWFFAPELGRWATDHTGGTSQHINCGNIGSFPATTASVWVYYPSGTSGAPLTKSYASWEWQLSYSSSGYLEWHWGAVSLYKYIGIFNEWMHLCGVGDGSASRVYVNGVEQDSGGGASPSSSQHVGIGGRANGTFGGGKVSDALVFSRVLSVSEIRQLADPCNRLIGGLIWPEAPRFFPVAAAPAAVTATGSPVSLGAEPVALVDVVASATTEAVAAGAEAHGLASVVVAACGDLDSLGASLAALVDLASEATAEAAAAGAEAAGLASVLVTAICTGGVAAAGSESAGACTVLVAATAATSGSGAVLESRLIVGLQVGQIIGRLSCGRRITGAIMATRRINGDITANRRIGGSIIMAC